MSLHQLSLEELAPLLALPLTTSPDTPLATVLSLMHTQGQVESLGTEKSLWEGAKNHERASCVLIVEGEQLVGTFAATDLVRVALGELELETTTVGQIMTREPITIEKSQLEDIFTLLKIFHDGGISHLPVIDELNRIVGLVTPAFIHQVVQPANFLQLTNVAAVESQILQVSPTTSILDVLRLMAVGPVSCAAIPPETNQTTAVFTEWELLHCLTLGLDLAAVAVGEVAIAPVTVTAEASLWEANQLLLANRARCLIVTTDGGEITGTISPLSILNAINSPAIYQTTRLLQAQVSQLETEKLQILEREKIELEAQVQQRTLELQQQARCDRLLVEICSHIRLSLDLEEILGTAASQLREFLQCDRVFIYRFDPDWSGVVVAEDVQEGIKPLIGERFHDPCFAPTWVDAYQNGRLGVVNDIHASDLTPCHIELLETLPIRSQILVPILLTTKAEDGSSSNYIWGLINVSETAKSREWQSVEVQLLRRLATQLAIAIQQSNLYQLSRGEVRERQQAESSLTQERNLLSAILNVAGALIVVFNKEGRIMRFNKTCEEITGYKFDEVFGRFMWDFLLIPEETESVKGVWEQLLAGEFPTQYENYWVTKTGSRRLIAWSNTGLRDGAGNLEYIVAAGIDISDRRQAELELQKLNTELEKRVEKRTAELQQTNQQLQVEIIERQRMAVSLVQSQEVLRDLFENLNDLVHSISLETGKVLYANRAWYETLGYEKDDLDRLSVFDIIAPERREVYRQIFSEFKAGKLKQFQRLEIPFLTKSGKKIILEGSINCRYQNGKPIATRGIFRDLTERKRTEEHLKEVMQEFSYHKQALDRFALVAMTDADGVMTYVNDKLCEVSQYEREELIGQSHSLLNSGYHPQSFFEKMWSTITQGQIWRGEIKNRAKDGSFYWVDTVIVPFLDVEGRPKQYLAIRIEISDRKEAEAKIIESQQLLQLVMDSIPHYIFWKSLNSVYLGCNQNFARVVGLKTTEEVVGKTDYDLPCTKEEADWYQQCDREVMESNQPKYHILETQHNSEGKEIWVDTNKVPLHDATGNVVGILGNYEDITERKQAEEKLQQQLAAIEASGDGIAILKEGKYVYVNQAHAHIFGYKNAAELIGKSLRAVYAASEINRLEKEVLPLLAQQKYWRGEAIAKRKNGTHFIEGLSLTLREDGSLISVCQDITEKLKIEEKIRRRDAQFRAIFEQAAVGISRFALNGQFLQVNQRMCQMLGYTQEEMLTKTMAEISHPEEWEIDMDYLEPILKGEAETFSREKRYLQKEGSVFWGKITVSVVRGSSKHTDYFIGILEDISERKKAEEEIKSALARAQELSELKSRFISMTSHEFRTPLAVISSAAGILKTFNSKLTDEKRLNHLNNIETYVKHTTRLLDDILLINRAEAGNIEFNPQPINVVNYCENVTQEMQTSTANHVLVFTNHCPLDTSAKLDLKLLQQVLINLLSNGIKYSPEGREIKFSLSMTEDRLIFQVTDSGIGIPPEDQKRLFESFHRATNVGTIQGTGLGLSIVKKCVELHGGEISFTSELGAGTTFTVTVPKLI